MNILTNIITYFAKFPARAGVLNNFASSTEKYPGYQALKTAIQNLPSPLLPEIEEMVFSTSEMVLSVKLKNTNGFFLLLEYGAVNTDTENRAGARESNISLALTVGYPYKNGNIDTIEEALIMDKCLALVSAIVNQMIEDNDSDTEPICHLGHFIEGSFKIAPIEPMLLYNNMGFTATFSNNVTVLS